jgi:hypothetical protein
MKKEAGRISTIDLQKMVSGASNQTIIWPWQMGRVW